MNHRRFALWTNCCRLDAVRAYVWAIVQRVRADLSGKPEAVMAWEPIPLEVFDNLPTEIKSSWVFVLRAGTNTGPERHPNSHQRMMSFAGGGDLQTGELDVWKSNVLTSDPAAQWEERWVSIPPNVWHQPVVPNESDWVVVSFSHRAGGGVDRGAPRRSSRRDEANEVSGEERSNGALCSVVIFSRALIPGTISLRQHRFHARADAPPPRATQA